MTAPDFSTTLVLLKDAKAGRDDALNDLLARYAPRIKQAVAISLGRMPNRAADIDDVVQEVLLAAFRNFDRYEVRTDASFMGWLVTIVLNKIRDLAKREKAQKRGGGKVQRLADLADTTTAEPAIPARGPTPTQVAREHELAEAEQEALVQLPERHREVIVFHDLLGMSHAEIAPRLGYKTDAPPRALYNRARKKLSEILRRFEEPGAAAAAAD